MYDKFKSNLPLGDCVALKKVRNRVKNLFIWKDFRNATKISWQHLKEPRYWWVRLLLFVGMATIAVAIWAQATRDTDSPNRFAVWLYTFINDWAALLYTLATIMLAMGAFLAILDNRNARRIEARAKMIRDIMAWAKDAIWILSSSASLRNLRLSMQKVNAGMLMASADARSIGGDLETLVHQAVRSINKFGARVSSQPQIPASRFQRSLLVVNTRLTRVMNCASTEILSL